MVPLLPTQPLSLASGLLFGAKNVRLSLLSTHPRAPVLCLTVPRSFVLFGITWALLDARHSTSLQVPSDGPAQQPPTARRHYLSNAQQGALLMLLGVTLAGLGAFSVARGVGRPLAERIIKAEMGDHEGGSGDGKGASSAWASVEAAIESGGFFKQVTAVTLLRLTPVVPYRCGRVRSGRPARAAAACCAAPPAWHTVLVT
jgi:hypothetical protein